MGASAGIKHVSGVAGPNAAEAAGKWLVGMLSPLCDIAGWEERYTKFETGARRSVGKSSNGVWLVYILSAQGDVGEHV